MCVKGRKREERKRERESEGEEGFYQILVSRRNSYTKSGLNSFFFGCVISILS